MNVLTVILCACVIFFQNRAAGKKGPAGSSHPVTPAPTTVSSEVCSVRASDRKDAGGRRRTENRGALCLRGCSSRSGSTVRGGVLNRSGLSRSAPTQTHAGRGGRLAACVSTHSPSLWRGSADARRRFSFNIQELCTNQQLFPLINSK